MDTFDLSRSREQVENTFPDNAPEVEVCQYVFHLVEVLGVDFSRISLGEVASGLGWIKDSSKKEAIARAMDFLSKGSQSIFERRYELWAEEEDEILDEPIYELSHNEIRTALEQGALIVDGEEVVNFLDRVHVFYSLRMEGSDEGHPT